MKLNVDSCDLCGSGDVWDVMSGVTLCWDCESTVAYTVLFQEVPFSTAVEFLRLRIEAVDNV